MRKKRSKKLNSEFKKLFRNIEKKLGKLNWKNLSKFSLYVILILCAHGYFGPAAMASVEIINSMII